jgi:cell division protein ZipA
MVDLGLRDWLLILGPLVIAGVLVHGYWKMRKGTPKLKMSLDKEFLNGSGEADDTDDLALLRGELPNGGSRIVKQDVNKDSPSTPSHVADLNLDEDVPVLMDPVHLDADAGEDAGDQLEFESLITSEELVESPVPEEKQQAPTQQDVEKAPRPERLFVINVLPKQDEFNGQYLLESLVTCGFQFGAMDIFHYMDDSSNEPIFSLVNAVEPGTFDPNTMDQLLTPGVCVFIKLHELDDPVVGFKQMIETVKQLAAELDAVIQDSKHNSITTQTLDHEMQMVREYGVRYP